MDYYLITFSNTHAAIAAQKHLEGKLAFSTMPTLREISNSCGISLKIVSDSSQPIFAAMAGFASGSQVYQVYEVSGKQITCLKS